MNRETKGKFGLVMAAVVALTVILGVAGTYVSMFSTYILPDQEKWGQFGDYFGGVLNPILSFFAFIALLVTLRTQFVANEDGERRHDEQLREQRLFQLIGLMNESALNTKHLTVQYSYLSNKQDEYVHGHQAQHHAAMTLRDALSQIVRISAQINTADMEIYRSAQDKFQAWRKDMWPSVGIFVDSVFLVLDFVLKERSSSSFKLFSVNTLRVQLSESERLLIWYSALFTADYSIYLTPLLHSGFIDDHNGTLDDQIKPWRRKMIDCSYIWSAMEMERRSSMSKSIWDGDL